MPFGSTFVPTFLTSHFLPRRDARTEPVGAREGRNVGIVTDGADIAIAVSGVEEAAELRLWMPAIGAPGLTYVGEADAASVWALPSDRASSGPTSAPLPRVPSLPDGVSMMGLREAGPRLSEQEMGLALTSVGMVAWHRDYSFCPQCGAQTDAIRYGWAQCCANDHLQFPRTDAAVIVAIVDQRDRLLLAHNRRNKTAMVSVLAGFVEPGEDFESAIHREIYEEVGLEVEALEYRASQPWPYPRSLMVGYRARVKSGVDPDILTLQEEEIETARWWSRRDFLQAREARALVIPDSASISRALIDEWATQPTLEGQPA